jgi:uncharacterized protein
VPIRPARPLLLVLSLFTLGCEAALSGAASSRGTWKDLPGAPTFDPSLVRRLEAAVAGRGPGYRPRSRHLNRDGSAVYTNRLILEASPYLIQHAHNPVNWFPWSDEAFETARSTGRPVLLSVGYSTCHWCHVMEEESFEDEEIAGFLNAHYVAVKVDREERPDVDGVYMSAIQSLGGRGGWPMTVWLTPDRKPFYGGTYFPARDGDRGSAIGFLTLLEKLAATYRTPGNSLIRTAEEVTRALQADLAASSPGDLPGFGLLRGAAEIYRARFDPENGGLAGRMKFPSGLPIRFLLRHHRRSGDEAFLKMAVLTLEKMAAGGIHDQLGGGFHRYSTDPQWLVPHFEKMLYDNALIALDALEAYQATGRAEFAGIARETLAYAQREMSSPRGGFYSATDADSPVPGGRREEGRFFTWTPEEIDAAVGKARGELVRDYYGVTPRGNLDGRNVLHVARPLEEAARRLGISSEKARGELEAAKKLLEAARRERPPPFRDEKILAAWNGLMISALARGGLVLGEEALTRRAARCADLLLQSARRGGRLLRAVPVAGAPRDGTLSDYAFLIAGLLDLYEASGDPRRLRQALDLDAVLAKHYEDPVRGGFFLTADDGEKLLAREKPAYDGAEPSGNSVAVMNLLRLHEFTTEDRFRQRAVRALRSQAKLLADSPAALSEMLLAADFLLDTPREIVLIVPASRRDADAFLARLAAVYAPNRVLVVAAEGGDLEEQEKLVPYLEGKKTLRGKTTAYVCEKRVCRLPTTDPVAFGRLLEKVEPLPAPSARDTPGRSNGRP